jgi:2-(1,2-epoxy-1,2-dihydrophenyl)acetyl-CoA isomerase
MLNQEFDAVEAERLHLVNAVLDDAQLEQQAYEWIDRLAEGPTRAFGGMKRLVAKAFEQNLGDHISLEHACWNVCSKTFDFRAAVKARLAGDKAKFTGA